MFAGSLFVKDDATGKEYYQADSGELICVLSLPTAMLDLPIRSYGALEARSFEAFAEHLPPPGTSTTIVLKPILSAKGAPPTEAKPAAKTASGVDLHAEEESQAIAAIQPWLALVDRGDYSQGWEMAAAPSKNAVDRRDFVKSLTDVRKPLGAVKSRELVSKLYATNLPGVRRVITSWCSTRLRSPTSRRPSRPSRRCWKRTRSGASRGITSSEGRGIFHSPAKSLRRAASSCWSSLCCTSAAIWAFLPRVLRACKYRT